VTARDLLESIRAIVREGIPWHERVTRALGAPPAVLYHATTPRKLARYTATGAILPPVRGFDTRRAAVEWGRIHHRSVVLRLDVDPLLVQALPDHHLAEGLAWWTPRRVERWSAS
jgi:RNA:NAD 2'-phosphotransferase (TPT1/KptA family)